MKKTKQFMLIALMGVFSIGTASAQCTTSFTANNNGGGSGTFVFSGNFTPNGNNVSYSWDLGDGSYASGQNYTHTYANSGTYTVCLTATDSTPGTACTVTFCDTVVVTGSTTPPCNASFSFVDNGNGDVTLTASPAGNYYYYWDLGDGNYGSGQNYTHTYTNAGAYNVCLTINDTVFGGTCTSTFCDSIPVSGSGTPPCNVAAGISMTDNGQGNYTFTSTSTGNVSTNVWGFGDGTSGVGSSVNHTFAANGTYIVSLLSADSNSFFGCYDYATMTIVVMGVANPIACQAGFVIFPDSMNPQSGGIIVINSSTGNNLNYFWDFGDGNTSTLAYPNYTYNSNGPFNLCLTVDDGNGCVSTYCDSIGSNGMVLKGASGFTINTNNPEGTVGVNEYKNITGVELFPNPVKNNVNIAFNLETSTNVAIFITDVLGNEVAVITAEEMNAGINKVNYNTAAMVNGIYLLNIRTENTLQVEKIVINK